jgi:hypothetical protein
MVAACSDGTAHPGPAAPGQAHSPQQAAQAFLDAVAAGQADDALTFLLDPAYSELTTDAVLAQAVRDAPITQITTSLRDGATEDDAAKGHAVVDVAYRIGGQDITDSYKMAKDGEYWFIDEALPTTPAFTSHPEGVAITINDVVVVSEEYAPIVRRSVVDTSEVKSASVLPGLYRFGVDNPLLSVDGAEFTVTGLHTYITEMTGSGTVTGRISNGGNTTEGTYLAPGYLSVVGPHLRLTETGRQKVAVAAQEKLSSCLSGTVRDSCSMDDMYTWPPMIEGTTLSSIIPGSTDLTTTRPDWQACQASFRTVLSICAGGIYVAVPVTVQTWDGNIVTFILEVVGYTADISDPDNIEVAFMLTDRPRSPNP